MSLFRVRKLPDVHKILCPRFSGKNTPNPGTQKIGSQIVFTIYRLYFVRAKNRENLTPFYKVFYFFPVAEFNASSSD